VEDPEGLHLGGITSVPEILIPVLSNVGLLLEALCFGVGIGAVFRCTSHFYLRQERSTTCSSLFMSEANACISHVFNILSLFGLTRLVGEGL
jgi:hypothetical protein